MVSYAFFFFLICVWKIQSERIQKTSRFRSRTVHREHYFGVLCVFVFRNTVWKQFLKIRVPCVFRKTVHKQRFKDMFPDLFGQNIRKRKSEINKLINQFNTFFIFNLYYLFVSVYKDYIILKRKNLSNNLNFLYHQSLINTK